MTQTTTTRVPAHAAGPGLPEIALEFLAEAGWARYDDAKGNAACVSPDGQLRTEFSPEHQLYVAGRRALWQVTYTDPNPYRQRGWSAQFGDQVPTEAICAFPEAVTDPAGLDPHHSA